MVPLTKTSFISINYKYQRNKKKHDLLIEISNEYFYLFIYSLFPLLILCNDKIIFLLLHLTFDLHTLFAHLMGVFLYGNLNIIYFME